jgi:hypothetical protein
MGGAVTFTGVVPALALDNRSPAYEAFTVHDPGCRVTLEMLAVQVLTPIKHVEIVEFPRLTVFVPLVAVKVTEPEGVMSSAKPLTVALNVIGVGYKPEAGVAVTVVVVLRMERPAAPLAVAPTLMKAMPPMATTDSRLQPNVLFRIPPLSPSLSIAPTWSALPPFRALRRAPTR